MKNRKSGQVYSPVGIQGDVFGRIEPGWKVLAQFEKDGHHSMQFFHLVGITG
jgi:hypothetical protein